MPTRNQQSLRYGIANQRNAHDTNTYGTVVLIHGAATTDRIWRFVRNELRFISPNLNIIIPNRRCSGNLDREIADLWNLCSNSVVVGVSGGATIAWELAARGCPMKAVVAHEPAAGNFEPTLLSYPAQAWSIPDMDERKKATIFAQRLYGHQWTPKELSDDPTAVYRDYLMFSTFEPRPPAIERSKILLTVGQHSTRIRHRVSHIYAVQFFVRSKTLANTGHCVQLEQPQEFAKLIVNILDKSMISN